MRNSVQHVDDRSLQALEASAWDLPIMNAYRTFRLPKATQNVTDDRDGWNSSRRVSWDEVSKNCRQRSFVCTPYDQKRAKPTRPVGYTLMWA
ncbi:hypothetical protein BIW11_10314 [Tropilaelaps mercedesae]|uniref:Uncharacterized protein n=1 Tax=Tropilaelaps mercedesae TaxID=418985 RepID=A0A1V9XG96_9ACAR|nr:hypothetical protein BIW11_10314 [Tropilaelaps mercedesae]